MVLWCIWIERNNEIFRGTLSSIETLVSVVNLRVMKWALARKECANLKLNDILRNWEACKECAQVREKRTVNRAPPQSGGLKFNIDEQPRKS